MIYTYSPNWYKPQCLHFSNQTLFYCSNYILYEYSLLQKQVKRQLCFRQVAIQYNLNHKDIKINAITSNQKDLFVGINQPYLAVADKATLQIIKIVSIQTFQSIEYVHLFEYKLEQYAILCNKEGNLIKYSINEQNQALQKLQIKHKLSGIKSIYSIDDHHCVVFTRGTILVYNPDFTKLEKIIQASANDTIFSVDHLQHNSKHYFAFLTRNKDSYTIIIFQFKFNLQFPLQYKRKIQQIGVNIQKIDVSIYYPKKFAQKIKLNQKASLTIKLISPNRIILTGKLGQIMTISTNQIKEGSNLVIKPYSYQQQQLKQYQVWTDAKHYKQIYFIYQHQNRLYIISTDHNLTVWVKNTNQTVKFMYTIKFLTSSIQNFFYSENDPRNIFALLKDSAVRSFTPLDEGSHQLSEYWKFSKKYKIKKAVCHTLELGVLGLVTECNKIQIYDVFQDRLMKLIDFGQQIINISFQYPSIVKAIESMMKYQLKQEKVQYVSHFIKEMDNKTVLLVQTKSSLIIISNLAQTQIKAFKGPREKRLQRIHENRYWDQILLLSSHTKNLALDLFIRYKDVSIQTQIQLKYQQGRTLFKSPRKSNQITVINFKGTKFALFKMNINLEETKIELLLTMQVVFQTPIDYLNINYHDNRVAVYSQRDDALILVHLDKLKQQKYELTKNCDQAQLYWVNAKIDCLCFYLQNYFILATKDQAIKVLAIADLEELKKVNRKKKAEVTKLEQINTQKQLQIQ